MMLITNLNRTFRMTDLETGESVVYDFNLMIDANADDDEACLAIDDLRPGQSVVMGDGAAPAVKIERLS